MKCLLIVHFVFQWLCIPFALTHQAVSPITDTAWGHDGWIGSLSSDVSLCSYVDSALMLLLGGSVWSVRILLSVTTIVVLRPLIDVICTLNVVCSCIYSVCISVFCHSEVFVMPRSCVMCRVLLVSA